MVHDYVVLDLQGFYNCRHHHIGEKSLRGSSFPMDILESLQAMQINGPNLVTKILANSVASSPVVKGEWIIPHSGWMGIVKTRTRFWGERKKLVLPQKPSQRKKETISLFLHRKLKEGKEQLLSCSRNGMYLLHLYVGVQTIFTSAPVQ